MFSKRFVASVRRCFSTTTVSGSPMKDSELTKSSDHQLLGGIFTVIMSVGAVLNEGKNVSNKVDKMGGDMKSLGKEMKSLEDKMGGDMKSLGKEMKSLEDKMGGDMKSLGKEMKSLKDKMGADMKSLEDKLSVKLDNNGKDMRDFERTMFSLISNLQGTLVNFSLLQSSKGELSSKDVSGKPP